MKSDKFKQEFLEQLRKTPIVEYACKKAGIGRTTFYRWKRESNEFHELADEALSEGISLISDIAEANLISGVKSGDTQSVLFWLRHHRDAYKNKVEIDGRIKQVDENLTPEQAAIVEQALKLASPGNKKHEQNNDKGGNN